MSSGPDRGTCTACRGSGRLISTLGGEPHDVECPWCGGSGRFAPGRDAQAQAPADPQAPADSKAPADPQAPPFPAAADEP